MTAATALIAGNDPSPELAAAAVEQALAGAGLTHANGILLLLTQEFARTAQSAVHAAARAGKCLHVTGGIVAGVANEKSWIFDRPAAVALVLGEQYSLNSEDADGNLVCFAADASLPLPWRDDAKRCGLIYEDPLIKAPFPAWQAGRLSPEHRATAAVVGGRRHIAVSTGLRRLGPYRRVDEAASFELTRLGGMKAVDVLRRELPSSHRQAAESDATSLPLQHLCAMLGEDGGPALPQLLPIVSSHKDGSLTLGDRIRPGDSLAFAVRQPIDAERELQLRLDELSTACPHPDFGLFFSCIGRGPYFYAGDDRDWQLFRERFPHMPFIGGYGNGQIAPVPEARALQHCVVLNVFSG